MPEPINEADVRHVAKLARLRLSDAQVAHFTEQLAHILGHIDKLQEVDVEGVEPMAHALDLRNALRDDAEQPGMATDAALANAPAADEPFFVVPKVLGEGPGA
jgi:aspartyl/glutamyl-tRNA(Asn/Gln) amidotransferase C subunit